MRSSSFAFLSVAFLMVACAGSPATRPRSRAQVATPNEGRREAHAPSLERPPLTRRAKLYFELHGRHFPLPLVRGTVSGHPTWMLVDTGANSHVVAGWFAHQIGLPIVKLGDVGTDHVGRRIATFRALHPAVALEDWGPLADGPMLVTDVPPLIEKLGIGAFISPQRLIEEGDATVLDLTAGEIRAGWFDDARAALGSDWTSLVGRGARLCEDTASPIQGLAYVIPATIEGRAVDLLIDTGAQRSDILAGSAAGKALLPGAVANKDQMFGASGRLLSRTLKGAHLVVGNVAMTGDVDLLPGASDPYCPRDGVVSMDVLSACVLVLGRAEIYAGCKAH